MNGSDKISSFAPTLIIQLHLLQLRLAHDSYLYGEGYDSSRLQDCVAFDEELIIILFLKEWFETLTN